MGGSLIVCKEEIIEATLEVPGLAGRVDYAENLFDIVNRMPKGCRILEVGAMSGGSGVLMALTVQERGGVVYSVDPCFVPDSERPEHYIQFPVIGSLEGYLYNADKFGCEDIMFPLAGTTEEVLPRWPADRQLDFVFIDGDHTYECVKSDLQWLQFAQHKAIVAFDDWIIPVKEAVDEYMDAHKDWKLKLRTIPRWYVRNEADE